MALLKRAMADIPRIEVGRALSTHPTRCTPCVCLHRDLRHCGSPAPLLSRGSPASYRLCHKYPRWQQLEKDHPRMARLFQKGLLPFGIWEQLMDAEAMMDTEVHSVQAEAEKLQKGWG